MGLDLRWDTALRDLQSNWSPESAELRPLFGEPRAGGFLVLRDLGTIAGKQPYKNDVSGQNPSGGFGSAVPTIKEFSPFLKRSGFFPFVGSNR